MIVREESSGLIGESELLLPLGLILTTDGDRTVTSFPETLDVAEYLDSLPEKDIFTEKTKQRLSEMLFPRLKSLGYESKTVFSTEFVLDKKEKLNKSLILPSTELLLSGYDYENLTDCEPDPFGEGLLCFGTVIDGKIISAASENPHAPEDRVIDIGVETAEGFTGCGYAASNVASLAYYLLDPGISVTYIAEDENKASLRIAEKIGFLRNLKELRIVCERNNGKRDK